MNQLLSKEKWKYAFYTVSHPMDAYYEIRHRERGSVPVAIVLVILFAFSFSINRISASFIVNDLNPLTVNAYRIDCSTVNVLAVLCWKLVDYLPDGR